MINFRHGINILFIVLIPLLVLTVPVQCFAEESLQPEESHQPEKSLKSGNAQEKSKEQTAKQYQHNVFPADKKSFSFLTNKTIDSSAKQAEKKEPVTSMDALSVSTGLIFILLLIFSLAWFMRKMGYSNISGQGQLNILATLNLGQKEKIALIQVGRQQLLVGITATQINTLHVLDEPLDTVDAQTGTGNKSHFANKMTEILKSTQLKK